MKKALIVLLTLLVAATAFGQVTLSGDAKFAAAGYPDFFKDNGEQLIWYDDIRLYVDWKADDFTSGKITFRSIPTSVLVTSKTSEAGETITTTTSKSLVYLDSANFSTNLAGYMNLTGVTAKLSGGYCDLISGKIATLNAFQLSRIEYNLAKGYNLRADIGVPMATFYYGVDFSDAKYALKTAAYYPMLAGAYGSVAGVAYELAWGKPGIIDDLGSIMLQAKYGLRLPSKMLLTVAGGVDVDIDGTEANQLDKDAAMGNNVAGPLGTTKYVAAVRFSMPADVIGLAIDAGIDFSGSTEWLYTNKYSADAAAVAKSMQPWLANAIAFDAQIMHDIIGLDGGFVYDLNALNPGQKDGVAQWYIGVIKNIGKMELRAGYTYYAANDILGGLTGSSKDFRFSQDSDVYSYSNTSPAVNTGLIYVSTYIKF